MCVWPAISNPVQPVQQLLVMNWRPENEIYNRGYHLLHDMFMEINITSILMDLLPLTSRMNFGGATLKMV